MSDGGKRAWRASALAWLVVVMLVMWLPMPEFGGIDLRSAPVHGGCFAVGAVLLALADRRRPPLWRDTNARLHYLVVSIGRHLIRVAALLALYATILELGQVLAPGRSFRLGQWVNNIVWVAAACALFYWLTRVLLVGPALRRITEAHLREVSAAYRREAAYAAALRDHVQAAYAVCLDPSLAGESKLARLRNLLDRALGVELPNPDEAILDTVFGPRTAQRGGAAAGPTPEAPAAASPPGVLGIEG